MTTAVQPQSRTVNANGLNLHYLDWGKEGSTPLVLLHGLSGAAGDWQRVAEHFRDRYHVIALDQRGHGASDRAPDGAYGTNEAIADVEAFVNALGLKRFVLCGHSMGGQNTIGYTARHPERVICALANDMPPAFKTSNTTPPPAEHPVFASKATWIDARREGAPFTPEWGHELAADARLEAVEGGFRARHDPKAGGWRWDDLWEEAKTISRPIFFIRGGRSTVLDAQTLMDIDMAIAPARSITLEQSGHGTYVDMEHEWLAAAAAFFAAHSEV
ncbi:MAG: alpha/beta fold hydrolase [Dehalococcoidia bacterium]|nr:alpha/beta fold hydrolase [Dehalococcoidia bacterium]